MPANRPRQPSVPFIRKLQNDVRRAINFFPSGEKNLREGVDPSDLKRHIGYLVGSEHAKQTHHTAQAAVRRV